MSADTQESPVQLLPVKFNETKAQIIELKTSYTALTIAGVDDKTGYAAVDTARKEVKKKRVEIDKIRKSFNEKAQEFIKGNNATAKELTDILTEVEETCEAKIAAIDNEKENIRIAKEKAEQERNASRVKSLIDNGCSFDGVNYAIGENLSISQPTLLICSDEIFNQFLDKVKVQNEIEIAAKIEADRVAKELADKIEADRLAEVKRQQDLAEANRIESERLENLRKEQEAKQAEIDRKEKEIADREAAEARSLFIMRVGILRGLGMETTVNEACEYSTVSVSYNEIKNATTEDWATIVSDCEKEIAEIKEQQAIEAKRIADAQEAKRLQELEAAKQQAIQEEKDRQAKAEADRIEAEKLQQAENARQAALAPDKDKLLAVRDAINNLVMPDLSTDAAKAMLVNIKDLLTKTQLYISKQVKSL